MSSRSGSRAARKRMRQSTLASVPAEGDSKVRKLAATVPVLRGTWNDELIKEGLMVFEPHSWNGDNKDPVFNNSDPIKVAAFDLDSTLITTKTRVKFPKTALDWKFLLQKVPAMLATLASEGYVIVIFTNQAGVSNGRINEAFIKMRLESIMAAMTVDVGVFVATMKNNYRKPGTGMWEAFIRVLGGYNRVDMANSFYCGDAAGRPARAGLVKDFSDSDLRFSINIDLPFRTPEEYFGGKKQDAVSRDSVSGFDPRAFLQTQSDAAVITDSTDLDDLLRRITTPLDIVSELDMGSCVSGSAPARQTLVLMHGFPASGKSSFVKQHLIPRGYVWINQDSLQTFSRCSRATREALSNGRSVVIDNTNPDRAARAKYIDMAKAIDANIRIIALTLGTTRELAEHLNVVRERETNGGVRHIPLVAYHTYQKRVQKPELNERIDCIGEINFLPCFTSEREKYMFTRFA